jgi:hypothetical protein
MKSCTMLLIMFCASIGWAQDPTNLTGTNKSSDKPKETDLEWESRAIVGWHQAGASSADSTQNLFFDFFVARPLGKQGTVYDNKYNFWGQVRVASAPQQLTVPLSQFAASFTEQLGNVPVNKLAQSAEFLTGFEARPWGGWKGTSRIRTLGLVGFFGANGAFKDPATEARIFRVPPVNSPQWANFVTQFKEFSDEVLRSKATYIGLVPPDRERFYRQYGFGIRYTSYVAGHTDFAPAMFTATVGQDQSITHGRYVGPVLKFDAFYPMPFSEASFVYLFGTANLAVAKPSETTPLALELVSNDCAASAPSADAGVKCAVQPYQDNVAIHAIPSSRDTYRIGVGIDAIKFVKSLIDAAKPKPPQEATPTPRN